MSGALIHFEVDERGIALLAMRDPERKNALSAAMVQELEACCVEVSRDESIKVLIVTGLNEYFSTGADREMLHRLLTGKVPPARTAAATYPAGCADACHRSHEWSRNRGWARTRNLRRSHRNRQRKPLCC